MAMTWLMMAAEGPVIAAFIARMEDPKYNLAAYGVSFSLALILEAPVIMIMSVSTALVSGNKSFRMMWKFTQALNIMVSVAVFLLLIPGVFDLVASLLKLNPEVRDLTYRAMFFLIPWPAAIGIRRFYQGVLIRRGETQKVALGTVCRLGSGFLSCLLVVEFTELSGAELGALALASGVVSEALVVYLLSIRTVRELKNSDSTTEEEAGLTYGKIIHLYYPLALSATVVLCIQPLVTFFTAFCLHPLESLAVLPVMNSFIFIFRCIALSYQDVVIALLGDKFEGFSLLKNTAVKTGVFLVIVFMMMAFTPAAKFWFENVSGLSSELAAFLDTPLAIMVLVPFISLMVCTYRAAAIKVNATILVTYGTIIEVSVLVLVMSLGSYYSWTGINAAALAISTGRLLCAAYLMYAVSRKMRALQKVLSPVAPEFSSASKR